MAPPGANIQYLDITGLDEPLGVTDTHPIWSETRQDFVVAGQLEVGEQFRTLTGESATLTKIHPHRGPPELVDGEHVYSVAGYGLLVHNDCYLYHGTDLDSANSIINNGLNADSAKLVDEFWDSKGLSLTSDPKVAEAWAAFRARERGGKPAIIRVLADKIPARGPNADEYWDAGEKIIDQSNFPKVFGGIFELFK